MNHYQKLDQHLERIHAAARIVTKEHKNGKRVSIMTDKLNVIISEANAAFGMMGIQPEEECAPSTLDDFHKEALAILYEVRRKGGGRQAMIADKLSKIYFGANNGLIEFGQAI